MTVIFLKGAEILWEIIKGIISAIPDLIANLPQIVNAIFAFWQSINWFNLGKNLIDGIKKEDVSVSYENGVLHIILPKEEAKTSRTVFDID